MHFRNSSKLLLKRQRGKKLNFKQIMLYDHDLRIYQSIISLSLFGHFIQLPWNFRNIASRVYFSLDLDILVLFSLHLFDVLSLCVIFSTKYQRGQRNQNLTYCLQKEGILEPLISTFILVIYVKKFCSLKKKVMILDVRERC